MSNSKYALTAAEVTDIRRNLTLSQEEVATLLDVDISTIRKWESGSRPCEKANALVLRLLHRDPHLLTLLDENPKVLPRPKARKGTPEWFRLQRLLAVIGFAAMPQYFNQVVVAEGLTQDWLYGMEMEGLLQQSYKSSAFKYTGLAGEMYDLNTYYRWLREIGKPDDVTQWPVMCWQDYQRMTDR